MDIKTTYKEARQLQADKKYDEAVEKFKAILDHDPDYHVARQAMAQSLTELERHNDAIAEAKKVVDATPDDYFAYISLSRAYQRAGMIPEAEYAMMQGQQVQQRTGQ